MDIQLHQGCVQGMNHYYFSVGASTVDLCLYLPHPDTSLTLPCIWPSSLP